MTRTAPGFEKELSRGGVVDITTTGRRSEAPLLNLEAYPVFSFHLKRPVPADLPAVARVIDGEAERREILPHVARAWRRNDLEQMVRYSPLIEVTFPE